MNVLRFGIACMILAFAGCEHATNDQPVPEVHDFEILNPGQNTEVFGTVEVLVRFDGAPPEMIELYVNGVLHSSRTSKPWQYWWNTEGYPLNSEQKLTARAYSKANAFRSTPEVIVRVK